MSTIAFLGLGVMGGPMARHLAAAGHSLRLYNRSPAKAHALAAEIGATACASVAEAASAAEILCSCVGRDEDVESLAPAVLASLGASRGLWIDHTTISAALTRRLAAQAAAQGAGFLDAPVSGGQAGAENARLSVMAGGSTDAFARAEPIMRAYATTIVHIGPSGAGQLAKMANQIAIAGVVQGLAEAMHFARQAGLDAETLIAAISRGAAGSWQMDNRWRSMNEDRFDFGFAVDWMRKDLGLVLAEARANGARLPLTALVDQFYAEIQAMGGGKWDSSSLVRRL